LAERSHELSPSKSVEGSDLPNRTSPPAGLPLIAFTWTSECLTRVPRALSVQHSRHGLSSRDESGDLPFAGSGTCAARLAVKRASRPLVSLARVQSLSRILASTYSSEEPRGLPFHEVYLPTTFSNESSDQHREYLSRLCYAYRLSQPLDVLFRSRPIGLVSCRSAPGISPSEGSPVW
jgi:hypothetical protein